MSEHPDLTPEFAAQYQQLENEFERLRSASKTPLPPDKDEMEAIQQQLAQLRQELQQLHQTLKQSESAFADAQRNLNTERDAVSKLEKEKKQLEADLQAARSQPKPTKPTKPTFESPVQCPHCQHFALTKAVHRKGNKIKCPNCERFFDPR